MRVKVGSAEVGGVGNGVEGEDRGGIAGEEGKMKVFPVGPGDHVMGVVRAAEGVLMLEALSGWDLEPVDGAGGCRIHVGIEDGADFFRLQDADGGDDVGLYESEGELCFGDADIAGDAGGGIAGGAPIAVIRLLRDGGQ